MNAGAGGATPVRILVAEDDRTSRIVMESTLRKAGYEPVLACDGAEALALLSQPDAPRLALLDWMMPLVEGPEVCRRVRERDGARAPYLVLLTARKGVDDTAGGLRAGADDYVAKPFDRRELLARIDVGLRTVALRDELASRVTELQALLEKVRVLEGLLPICVHCKSIRTEQGTWQAVESYVSARSDAEFTHGICPPCFARETLPIVD